MQDVIIAYAGKYGTTEEIAGRIKAELTAIAEQSADRLRELQITCLPLRALSAQQVQHSRMLVLGGAIYAGRLPRALRSFCERHRTVLLSRAVGLFSTCLYQDEQARDQLIRAYPPWLFAHAAATASLGGRLDLGRLSAVDRLLIKRFAKVHENLDRIDNQRISSFAGELFATLKRK